jgi:hypothetical protein
MLEASQKAAAGKKAYEVAYAVFRITASMNEQSISEALKNAAAEILEQAVAGDCEGSDRPLAVLDYFIKLAMDLGAMGFANGEILSRELGNLKSMVAECVREQSEAVDIRDFFAGILPKKESAPSPSGTIFEIGSQVADRAPKDISSHDFFREEGIAVSRAEEYQVGVGLKNGDFFGTESERNERANTAEANRTRNDGSRNNGMGGFLKSGMRQIAILDKIRQSGNCRMRDIQEILPDSSERTIRYDLESLMERRLIERMGNGGPSVSYRMRQI